MPYAVETAGLTRRFGPRLAVDDVDLQVPQGSVYGFLGPNGAGKTTTIRMLLGLLRPTRGDVIIYGERLKPSAWHLLRQVGALVEGPSLYPHLTGEENLEVTTRLLGLPRAAVARALERFELTLDARRLVRTYSSGMRQLLALAQAWLAEPRLLVLDEPTNSLDPAATRKLRRLLRHTVEDGRGTVFLSSHILAEVEQVADWIGIIHKGRLLHQAPLASLREAARGSLENFFMDLVAPQ
ncbi:MAG: ABC transporter ATP-binding protein [Vicinamibacterales bacterium]